MEHRKTVLLDQLRIERVQSAPPASSSTRLWWAGGVALCLTAATAIFFLTLGRESIEVHAVIAKPVLGIGSTSTGGSLLDASGYVVAMRQATVSAKSIYKVNEVLVQEGQSVAEGQVIARLDDTNARAALGQAKAAVRQLEAELRAARQAAENARPSFIRNQKQLGAKLISQDAFDSAKASYDAVQSAAPVAEERLAAAKAAVEVTARLVDDTIVRAPFDGVVTIKTAQPGEIVSPQFSGGGGIAKIVAMDSLEVHVDVSETFINRVHPDQPATITLNAYPDWRIPAAVIAVIPTADRAKATVKVRIGFKVKDARIVPEMGAKVSFLENAPQSSSAGSSHPAPGVIVPPEAILANGQAGVVFVIRGDRVERRTVQLGTRTDDGQTILTGVQPGTRLAIGPLDQLRDGLTVHVAPEGSK